jgi:hypothetical protein
MRCWGASPIDREHLAADEPLPVGHRQHRREDRRDLVAQCADEVRDHGEVGSRIAAQGNENQVLFARPGDGLAAHEVRRVGEQNRAKQYTRRIYWRIRGIVLAARVVRRQVNRVL